VDQDREFCLQRLKNIHGFVLTDNVRSPLGWDCICLLTRNGVYLLDAVGTYFETRCLSQEQHDEIAEEYEAAFEEFEALTGEDNPDHDWYEAPFEAITGLFDEDLIGMFRQGCKPGIPYFRFGPAVRDLFEEFENDTWYEDKNVIDSFTVGRVLGESDLVFSWEDLEEDEDLYRWFVILDEIQQAEPDKGKPSALRRFDLT